MVLSMAHLFRSLLSRLRGGKKGSYQTQYVQRPNVVSLGDEVLIASKDSRPHVLNDTAASIWKLLEVPRTKADLVSVLTQEYDVSRRTATADVEVLLDELTKSRFVAEIPPGGKVPVAAESGSEAAALLSEAYKQQRAGDWQAAMALCAEARKDPNYAPIAELDILIARYHLDMLDDLIEQAQALMPRLPAVAQLACSGLVLLSAHRIADVRTAKTVALYLARHVEEPSDLPTPPGFVALAGTAVVATEELSVEPMLAVIQQLQTSDECSDEERELLTTLAQRYASRQTPSN